jgi:hypothetical protein
MEFYKDFEQMSEKSKYEDRRLDSFIEQTLLKWGLLAVGVNELPVVPRRVIARFRVEDSVKRDRVTEGFWDRSAVMKGKRSPRLLIRPQ